ncbi:MAG: DUF2283 domain-containing protein [bacterium]|nr:DUF2283 domain-containing protein [bacterium]
MKVKYFEDADLLSFRISNEPYKYARQFDDVIIHYSAKKEPVLIEVIDAAKFLKKTTHLLPKKVQAKIWPGRVSTPVAHQIKR